ncbi:MAG TPA: HEPN domain-containing protein [Solirubrobacterales bacterium]
MPSDAHKALNDRLADVDQLMNGHTAIAGSTRGRKYEVVGINRAAILMLSAHLEGYVEDLFAEALSAVNSSLRGAAVTSGFHNPWPDRIDKLFAAIGMEQPCRSISWKKASNKAVRGNLELLVKRRNKIAHGTTDVTVYKEDVMRHRRYIEGFTERFDRAVRDHVKTLTGTFPWPP